jgi:plasmid stabilization system protein ParE
MAYKIIWLPVAEKRYDEIIGYLQENWTDKEIANFIARTEEVLEVIQTNPDIYRRSEKRDIRQALITKHNLLLYRKRSNKIELITFFDTRQNPSKKFK